MIVIDEDTRAALGLDVVAGRSELDQIKAQLERGLDDMARAMDSLDGVRKRVARQLCRLDASRMLSDRVLERMAGAKVQEGGDGVH